MATGYLVTLGDGSLDSGDAISASQSTFTIDQTIGTGSWTWNGVWENDGQFYGPVSDTGVYYTATDGNVYFIPDTWFTTSGTATAVSAPAYTAADGIVTGSAGNDVIDENYTDTDGDTVSAGNDTINAEGGDDTVYGGAGDDSIDGGTGADFIVGDQTIANDGMDTIAGGDGNDVIYGDTAAGTDNSPTFVSWANQGLADETSIAGGTTATSADGNINIDVTVLAEQNFYGASVETGDPLFNYNGASDTSSLTIEGGDIPTGNTIGNNPNAATITLDFSAAEPGYSDEVSDVTFGIFDIDELQNQFIDQITVTAYDADGNAIPVTVTLGSTTTLTSTTNANGSQTVESIVNSGGAGATDSATGFAEFNVAGPVSYIEIDYNNTDPAYGAHAIRIGDVELTPIPEEPLGGNADTISGDAGDDLIFGQGGDDSLSGGIGNDTLYGGDGADAIEYGSGLNTVYGGAGDDFIDDVDGGTSTGTNTIYGDAGNDSIWGSAGTDTIYGGTENDTINADIGNDSVYGGSGNDVLAGGAGDDVIGGFSSEAGNDIIFGDAGNDDLNGGNGDDTLYGGDDNDTLTGASGNDTAFGGQGSDTFNVTDDHETIVITGGEDAGDTDTDSVSFYNFETTQGVTVTSTGDEQGTFAYNAPSTSSGITSSGSYSQIEEMSGTFWDDTFDLGSDNSGVSVDANEGDDVITTGSGADVIEAGSGADTVNAGAGDDVIGLAANTGPDGDQDVIILQDGFGNDTISAFDAPTPNGDGTFTGIDTFDVTALTDGTRQVYAGDVVVTDDGSGNALLTMPNGESVTLFGIDPATADNPFWLNAVGFPLSDGTVEGTSGADTIGASYTGDPDGDMVDDGDAILPGDAGDDDLIYGYGGNDNIYSGSGNDEVYGGDGDDLLQDSAGDSTLDAGIGNDTINSGSGNDTVYGGDGDDVVGASIGSDEVYGGAGNDTMSAGGFAGAGDTLDGGAGNDTITGGSGNDSMFGGTGDDLISTSSNGGTDVIEGGEDVGNGDVDTLNFTDGAGPDGVSVTMSGDEAGDYSHPTQGGTGTFTEIEQLNLTDQNDTFDGTLATGGNTVDGAAGDDTLIGSSGADSFIGGTGNDTLNANGGDDTLDAGDGNDVVYGDAGSDSIAGGAGDDQLFGGTDADIIDGGADNDTIEGGSGDDTLTGGDGADTITGGADQDVIYGGAGDVIDGSETGVDNDTLIVSGVDFIDYDTNPENGIVYFEGGGSLTFSNIENVVVSDRDGTVSGTAGDDTINTTYVDPNDGDQVDDTDAIIIGHGTNDDLIEAGGGNDTVDSGVGADTVFGGTGNDLVYAGADSSADTVYGEAGSDSMFGFDGDDELYGGADNDMLDGDGGNDSLYGGTGDDQLIGDGGTDTMFGGDGADTFYAGVDNDTIYGGDGNDLAYGDLGDDRFELWLGDDTAFGGDGNDYIDGAQGNDQLHGGAGNDTILGGSDVGVDTLYGGDGNDILSAGDGNDTLAGGTGDDTQFGAGGDDVFDLDNNFGNDTITGGETGETVGDILDASDVTTDLTLDLSTLQPGNPEMGTLSDGTSTATFEEIEYVFLGTGDDSVTGSSGNDQVATNEGQDTINLGAGDDQLDLGQSGGGGDGDQDVIILQDGSGNDTILNFDAPTPDGDGTFTGVDTFDVTNLTDGTDPVNVNDVTVSDTNGDGTGDAILTFPNGESVTLVGIDPAVADDPFWLNAVGIPMSDGTVEGTAGDDLINGSYTGDPDSDMVDAGDAILPGDTGDDDLIYGYGGNDTILAGAGNDEVYGGDGNDSITGQSGFDTIFGGAGDDELTDGFGGATLDGGDGADTINAGYGDSTVVGGEGGVDNDTLSFADADDTVDILYDSDEGGDYADSDGDNGTFVEIENLILSSGDDTVDATADSVGVSVTAGDGADTLVGGSGGDTLRGDAGQDSLDGNAGADSLYGGDGNDTVTFAEGDTAEGGTGDDLFVLEDLGELSNGTISITGGTGGETLGGGDTLQLGTLADLSTLVQTSDGINADGNESFSGSVTLDDGTILNFSEIENIICFTPGTRIATPHGLVAIEDLEVGDLVVTRDHGLQPIRWIEGRTVPAVDRFAPVRIRPNVLSGQDRDLIVSPQHRVLFQGYRAELLFGESEVLVAAKHLIDGMDVTQVEGETVTYVHMLFDQHEIIYAEGAATESFHPGDIGFSAVGDAAREELFAIFPELRADPKHYGSTARRCLKAHEAKLIRS